MADIASSISLESVDNPLNELLVFPIIFSDGKISDNCSKSGAIYYWKNSITGKGYVGQTIALRRRMSVYRRLNHSNQRSLYNSMLKYGIQSFICYKIVECNNKDDLNKLEEHYIKKFNTISPTGYNLNMGGNSRLHSEETKSKMRGKIRNSEWISKLSESNRGKQCTNEHRQNMSLAATGKIISPETRRKLSLANKGKKKPPRSLEHREKISAANIGKIRTTSNEARNAKISASKIGKKRQPFSDEHRANIAIALTGRVCSAETRKKISDAHKRKVLRFEHNAKLSKTN